MTELRTGMEKFIVYPSQFFGGGKLHDRQCRGVTALAANRRFLEKRRMNKEGFKKMQEKKYLKWYNKVGYGSGDLAANTVYALLTSFVMFYLTDTVDLNAGVIGTLIMLSKFADGVTDIFFGRMMDKTHTKMGKARPWMLWSYIGNAICLIAIFSIPVSWGDGVKYVYFFIAYTLLNAVFYTANNIAYASLTALITKNNNERVQMGSIRFMFSLATNLVIASITTGAVAALGGGAAGWRNMAIICAVVGLIVNTISVFSVKELPEEELRDAETVAENVTPEDKLTFLDSFKLLMKNKYYLLICVIYIFTYVQTGIASVGVYYMQYVLGNASLLGLFSMAQMFPMIIGLALTPMLVAKMGSMYKLNLAGYTGAFIFRIGFMIGGYLGSIPLMLACSVIAGLCSSPLTGDLNALIAAASDWTYKTSGHRVDGTMFSCSSLGIKVGSGIGSALCGILLAAGGYINGADVQPQSALNMLQFMYLWFPMISIAIIWLCLKNLKVEQANAELDAKAAQK